MPNLPRAVSVFVSFGFCWVSFASGECFPPQNYTIDLVFSHSLLFLLLCRRFHRLISWLL